jgi:hypothetical protein
MLGGQNAGWSVIASGLIGWDVKALVDVDNDGSADVIVQNEADGVTYFADLNQGVFAGWGVVSGALPSDWQVV